VVLPEGAGRDVGLVASGRIEGLGLDEGDVVSSEGTEDVFEERRADPWFRWSCRAAIQRISAARDDRYSTTAKPTTPSSLVMTQPWCASRSLAILSGTSSVKKSGSPRTIVWRGTRSSGRRAVRAWRCMVAQRAQQGIEPLRSVNDPARSRRKARRRDLTRARWVAGRLPTDISQEGPARQRVLESRDLRAANPADSAYADQWSAGMTRFRH
jgi:hypothetical protein